MSVTPKGHYIMDLEAEAIQRRYTHVGTDPTYCAIELLNFYRPRMDHENGARADRTLHYHHQDLAGRAPVWG